MQDSAERHMNNNCREIVGTHCHCSLEYNMPENTRRACMVCEPNVRGPITIHTAEMVTDNYTAIPVYYSPEDNEWLISVIVLGYSRPVRDHIRCDCHDLVWHYSELTVLQGFDGTLFTDYLTCDLP